MRGLPGGLIDPGAARGALSNQADTKNMNTTSVAGQGVGSIDPAPAVSVSDPAAHASDPGTTWRLSPPE
ncbi:conserved hypothetical protein [Burkholderia cenocepacia]|nr:conserved hypothetical protein [Burkholderia cenocepacia]